MQLQNLLGALSLALADAQMSAVQQATGIGTGACAVLIALGQHPNITIKEIAAIAGLSHSVIVRTIDMLVLADLVVRETGKDKREVLPRLTSKGKVLRDAIVVARTSVLESALKGMSPERREILTSLLAEILTRLTTDRAQSDHMCRLCDEAACGLDCPVETEARRIEGLGSFSVPHRLQKP